MTLTNEAIQQALSVIPPDVRPDVMKIFQTLGININKDNNDIDEAFQSSADPIEDNKRSPGPNTGVMLEDGPPRPNRSVMLGGWTSEVETTP